MLTASDWCVRVCAAGGNDAIFAIVCGPAAAERVVKRWNEWTAARSAPATGSGAAGGAGGAAAATDDIKEVRRLPTDAASNDGSSGGGASGGVAFASIKLAGSEAIELATGIDAAPIELDDYVRRISLLL